MYFFCQFCEPAFLSVHEVPESQVFSCTILHLMTNEVVLAAKSYHRCEQGMVLGLVLVICRWCNQTSIVVQAPEILVHSGMVPTSTHLTPLRYLLFLGIFIYIMLLVADV